MTPPFPTLRRRALAVLSVFLAVTTVRGTPTPRPAAAAADRKAGAEPTAAEIERAMTKPTYLVILADSPRFAEAKREAEAIAKRSRVPFSMMGRVYDPKRGLILPDNDPDTLYAGNYFLRRGNEAADLPETGKPGRGFISIERSEAYDGLRGNLYIVVGGLYLSREEARQNLARFAAFAPGAYLRRTPIYYGCMH